VRRLFEQRKTNERFERGVAQFIGR